MPTICSLTQLFGERHVAGEISSSYQSKKKKKSSASEIASEHKRNKNCSSHSENKPVQLQEIWSWEKQSEYFIYSSHIPLCLILDYISKKNFPHLFLREVVLSLSNQFHIALTCGNEKRCFLSAQW